MSPAEQMDRLPWPPVKQISTRACNDLWGAVLTENIRAALGITLNRSQPSLNNADQRRAKAWLGTADFRTVCDLAGLEPEVVETFVRREIAAGSKSLPITKRCSSRLPVEVGK